jgi:hypothetical protein
MDFPRPARHRIKGGHYIAGVPFYRQGEDSCGSAALASVASFWGQQVNMEQIKVRVYLSGTARHAPMDMERFRAEAGFRRFFHRHPC